MNIEQWFAGIDTNEPSYSYVKNLYPITQVQMDRKFNDDKTEFEIVIKLKGYAININEPKSKDDRQPFELGYHAGMTLDIGGTSLNLYDAGSYDMNRAIKRASKQAGAMIKNFWKEKIDSDDDRMLFLVLPA